MVDFSIGLGLLCSPDLGFDKGEKDTFRWMSSVGNGSAHLLPMGSSLLIDAGVQRPPSRRCPSGPSQQNIRGLEGVVCTHADLDHIAGVVPILRAIPLEYCVSL